MLFFYYHLIQYNNKIINLQIKEINIKIEFKYLILVVHISK